MDFRMDVGLVSSSSNTTPPPPLSDSSQKLNLYGSGFSKQEKFNVDDDGWRNFTKVAKITNNVDDFSISKTMLQQRSSTTSTFSDAGHQQQMLSFSSPNLQTMPYYYSPSTTPYARNGGYGSGGLSAANMNGILTEPFTPSQWMELQHQALIYKYITSNSPVPSNLLNPIRKALDSAGLSRYAGTNLWPNTLGWGAFQLGFSNNTDPEPGRCRRTDGKKWRCSRDAVADQKYCERHVNRGRHRSRKPVEGQTSHSVSGATNTTAKFLPMSSSTSSAPVVPARGTSNNLGLFHHQLTNLQDGAPNPSAAGNLTRSYLNKATFCEKTEDTTPLSTLSANIGLKENQFLTQKHCDPRQEPSTTEFGFVCSDSLLNPLQKSTSLISYNSSKGDQSKSQHSFRQFMDEWPINQCEDSSIPWHAIDMQSDRTQLSIAIPMAASDFMSSTSSPTNQSRAISPLRLSRELDSTQMGLDFIETDQRQANWVPISWENSMGGPLGEVLHSTNNSAGDFNDTSALNLMTEGWDNSPRLPSSPTGVLQKTTFRSLSNSSAGSSPRTENNLVGMHHIGSSLPAL